MAGNTITYPLNGAANWENFPDIVQKIQAGYMRLGLTELDTVNAPKIAAGSTVDVNGSCCVFSSEESISGTTSSSTWYDIKLTVSGSSVTASFVARGTGVWSDAKQGLYDGNDRIIGCVYKDASGNFINKNVLFAINRLIEITMEIGDWNMDTTNDKSVGHGLGSDFIKVRSVSALIKLDSGAGLFPIDKMSATYHLEGAIQTVDASWIYLTRTPSGFFDQTGFDAAGNRGFLMVIYKV